MLKFLGWARVIAKVLISPRPRRVKAPPAGPKARIQYIHTNDRRKS